ncbi:hypothetical protein KFK09_000660 [Dendrobium nobile]|uniref:Uncharacterized protein n=1 Tax=Dendrobium nobile TaxID=94219 RepID=A0A8T3C978_DENNO|nr:hypothetical protein KFK09_000660 [Dendrobium nobile]
MGNVRALLLLLILPVLVSSSRFLLHEARPLHSSITKQNMATAVRKGGGGGGGHGGGRGARGDSNGSSHGYSNGDSSSSSPYGKAIPLITEGSVLPKSLGASSHKHKHNSAHSGYSFSIATVLIVSAFWLDSLACLCSFSY